jgi:hypothetical protein
MLRTLAICSTVLAVVAGASSSTAGSGSAPAAACRPARVAGMITEFLTAFNRGDARAAVRIMDPESVPRSHRPPGWYHVGETHPRRHGREHSFRRRASLMRYFERRHRQHEHMRLLAVRVDAGGGIVFRVHRTADDLDALGITKNRVALGKGAVLCARRKIFVWSMVHPAENVGGHTCPGRVLACARRR